MSDFSDLVDDVVGAVRSHKLITAVVLLVGLWIVGTMLPEPEGSRAARIIRDVTTGCQELVRGQLKAPATAKFPSP